VLGFRAAAIGGERLRDLGEDALTDDVPRVCERKGNVCVKALELCRIAGASDPGVE
jgi:hypothetical protein